MYLNKCHHKDGSVMNKDFKILASSLIGKEISKLLFESKENKNKKRIESYGLKY